MAAGEPEHLRMTEGQAESGGGQLSEELVMRNWFQGTSVPHYSSFPQYITERQLLALLNAQDCLVRTEVASLHHPAGSQVPPGQLLKSCLLRVPDSQMDPVWLH